MSPETAVKRAKASGDEVKGLLQVLNEADQTWGSYLCCLEHGVFTCYEGGDKNNVAVQHRLPVSARARTADKMFPFQSSPFQILDIAGEGQPVIISLAANTAEERQKWANALKQGHFALSDNQLEIEERLAEFYRRFAPDKLNDMRFIPKLVHLFKGKEQELCDKLCRKYCPAMVGILSTKDWGQVNQPEPGEAFAMEGILLRQKHYPKQTWLKSYFVLQGKSLFRYTEDVTPSTLRSTDPSFCAVLPVPETVYLLAHAGEKVAMVDGLGFCVEVDYHGTHAVLMLSAESIPEKEQWVGSLNAAISGPGPEEEHTAPAQHAEPEEPELLLDFPELMEGGSAPTSSTTTTTTTPAQSVAGPPLTVATDTTEEDTATIEKQFRQMGQTKKKVN
jgi:hypothetical protein